MIGTAAPARDPMGAPPRPPDRRGGLDRMLVDVEERFIVPVQRSPRAALWAAGHRALSLPFTLAGSGRRYLGHTAGKRVPVVCVGREKRFRPILDRLFEEVEPLEELTRLPLSSPGRFAQLPASLLAVEVHPWRASRFADAGWVVVPDAVRWRGDLDSVPPARRSHSLRSDLNKIRKFGYTLEVADGPEDWSEFFDRMVLPNARERFGQGAWIPSEALRRDFAAAGRLLFACRDGARVAAACAIARGDTLWVPLIGVRAGDPRLVREGAGSAACAFSVDWARESGFRVLDWGRTSPFLNDGVQRFNRKWGFSPVRDPITHLTALRIDPRSAPLREAFAREPVLVYGGAGLHVYEG